MAGIEKMTAGLLDTLGVEHALYTQGSMPSHSPLTGEQIAAVRIADAADTDAEGERLRTTMQQAFARLRLGMPGKLPAPVDDIADVLAPEILAGVNQALTISATGSKETVRGDLARLIETYQPDEVILTGQIHDHDARLRSFKIAAEILGNS